MSRQKQEELLFRHSPASKSPIRLAASRRTEIIGVDDNKLYLMVQ